MKQRGQKSRAALTTVAVLPVRMLQPPADLTAEQAAVWSRVAATKPGDWWDAGSLPLLAQYCRASVEAERVGEAVERISQDMLSPDFDIDAYKAMRRIQAQLTTEMSTLARSMRLTQQARYRADRADSESRKANGRKPWQHDVLEG